MTFRWPWVARSTLERAELAHAQVIGLHEQRARELRADLLSERTRSASLTATVLRMKRDGAVLLPPQSAQLRTERRGLSAIEQAIDANPHFRRARPDSRRTRSPGRSGRRRRA
jgi:hypothetical protein